MAITRLNQAADPTGLPRRAAFCPRPDQIGANKRAEVIRNANNKIVQQLLYIDEETGETCYARTTQRDTNDKITSFGYWTRVDNIELNLESGSDAQAFTTTNICWSQGFTTVDSIKVVAVGVQLTRNSQTDGDTDEVQFELQSDTAGVPSGTEVSGASLTDFSSLPKSALPSATAEWRIFQLTQSVTLSAATLYHFVIKDTNPTASGNLTVIGNNSGAYTGGQAARSDTDEVSNWTAEASKDLNFRIYTVE